MTPPEPLSRRVLNRTLLTRQGLLERTARDPIDVVRMLVGMQAQEPIDPYVGLWSRVASFDPMTVSDAIEDRRLVRMGSLRTTLHLLAIDDALAMAPLTSGVHRRVFGSTGFAKALAGVELDEVVEAARIALERGPLTPTDLGRELSVRWPDRDPTALANLARYSLPLVQVPPRGLWGGRGRATNTTLRVWAGREPVATTVAALVVRYLWAFGPATVGDIRTWSGFTGLREVVDRLGPRLRVVRDTDGRHLLDVEDGVITDPDLPAPVRFLPQYDNVFLSHADRSRIEGALSWGIDFGRRGPILVDGTIAAAWRVVRTTQTATLTVDLGRRLSRAERTDLAAEAERLSAFLDPDRAREVVIRTPS